MDKDNYVPIKIKKAIKEELVVMQGKLMQKMKRKVTLSDTVKWLIEHEN